MLQRKPWVGAWRKGGGTMLRGQPIREAKYGGY